MEPRANLAPLSDAARQEGRVEAVEADGMEVLAAEEEEPAMNAGAAPRAEEAEAAAPAIQTARTLPTRKESKQATAK